MQVRDRALDPGAVIQVATISTGLGALLVTVLLLAIGPRRGSMEIHRCFRWWVGPVVVVPSGEMALVAAALAAAPSSSLLSQA